MSKLLHTVDDITAYIESLGGVLTLAPQEGDGTPQIAWGDRFFYVAPDGVVPQGQPFATIVTKDYPGEPSSGLDREGAFRVNVSTTPETFAEHAGHVDDPTATDTVIAHPVYAAMGWLAVVDPAERTDATLRALLVGAHARATRAWDRRAERSASN